MTPHRSRKDRGSLELKVKYRGLPLIRRATGTQDPQLLNDYRAMCDALYETGRHEHLRAIQRGTLRVAVVFAAYRKGKLHELAAGDAAAKLAGAWTAWAATLPRGKHRRDIEGCGRRMIESIDLVADLPRRLREYRETMRARGHAPAFNHARNYARSFLRDTLGVSDILYQRVKEIPPIAHTATAGHPLSVERLAARIAALGPQHGAALYAMCVTGMGPSEYWGRWEDDGLAIHVHGTKRAQRNRLVPRVGPIPRPSVTRDAFKSKLRRLGTDTRPYDGRRTFTQLMIEAGIPRNRRRMYLGHGAKDATDLYERPERQDWLQQDGAVLARLVATLAPPPLTLVKAG